MPKLDPTTRAQQYAEEQAGNWVFDSDTGYCPFTRTRLEGVILRAHQDGAASAMKTGSLTALQQQSVLLILKQRLSSDEYDLAREFGMTLRDAKEMLRVLQRVADKLAAKDGTSNG